MIEIIISKNNEHDGLPLCTDKKLSPSFDSIRTESTQYEHLIRQSSGFNILPPPWEFNGQPCEISLYDNFCNFTLLNCDVTRGSLRKKIDPLKIFIMPPTEE